MYERSSKKITKKLNESSGRKLVVHEQVLLDNVHSESSDNTERSEHKKLFNYAKGKENNPNPVSHFDFAVCEKNDDGVEMVRLLIEVDGAFHRGSNRAYKTTKIRDNKKDEWVYDILKAGNIFLRLSTDGTTVNEEDEIVKRLENRSTIPIWYKKQHLY